MTNAELITGALATGTAYIGSRFTAMKEVSAGVDLALMAGEGLGYLLTLIGVLPPELAPIFAGLFVGSGADAFHKSQTPSPRAHVH